MDKAYEALMRSPHEGFIAVTEQGKIVGVNDAYCRMTGYSREELLTMTVRDLDVREPPEITAQKLKNFPNVGSDLFETQHLCKDGRVIDVRLSSVYVPGQNDHYYVFLQDISASKRLEERLRLSEERLLQAVELAGLGSFDHDHKSDHLEWSPELRRMCGITSDHHLTFASSLELVHPLDRPRVEEAITNAHRPSGDGHYEIEHRYVRPDGSICWVSKRARTYFEGEGEERRAVRTIGVMMDISERRRREEALLELQRRKDEYLAILAHELRNPMAAISSAARLLTMPGVPEDQVLLAKEGLLHRVDHLARLVDDLLDISRLIRGKVSLKKEQIDIADVLREALLATKPLLEEHEHTLDIVVHEALPVFGDFVRLEQILTNIVINAIKYTNTGGRIVITACRKEGMASVSIRDNGVGMNADFLPRIFDLFGQADDSLDHSSGGLGLGLSIVKKLVELHGGSIAARSDGLGQGAEFEVRLPLSEAPIQPDPHKYTPVRTKGLRVLVVEDNKDNAQLLASVLAAQGHAVEVASDGAAGLKAALEGAFDVILLDIGLPRLNGYKVAEELRTAGLRETLIIAITGYGQKQDLERSVKAGIDHHLLKPVDHEKLGSLLAAWQRDHQRS